MSIYFFGLAASLAAGLWFFFRPPANKRWVSLFLSAGGAFLVAIIFTHIIPELFEQIPELAGYILLCGFLLQILLENVSKGMEHGHAHTSASEKGLIVSYVALCIHELIEGMPLAYAISGNDPLFARQLVLGVMMHKIPVAITLGTVLLRQKVNPAKSVMLLSGFILCTLLGSAIQFLIGHRVENAEVWMFASLGLTIGILLHVSTTILFESSDHHRLSPPRIVVILLGITLGILI